MTWLLYGAYGYTGRLIARRGREAGTAPVVAGRNPVKTAALARELDVPHRVFALDDPHELRRGLEGVDLVLHAAGPFSGTFRPMVDACLDAGCHYLDITGEIAVLEAAFELDGRARDAGVLILPGVGFDVLPTDCAAVRAARRVDRPDELEIAFVSGTGPSPGTLKSQLEGAARPSRVRRDGVLVDVPHGSVIREVPFSDRRRTAVCIPWGDLSTAYRSTGIGNIRTYMVMPPGLARAGRLLSPLLRLRPLRTILEGAVEVLVSGPDEEDRRGARSRVWARAAAADGRFATVEYVLPDGYTFTARSSVAAVERILEGRLLEAPAGTTTPALLFGEDFAEEIEGVEAVRA